MLKTSILNVIRVLASALILLGAYQLYNRFGKNCDCNKPQASIGGLPEQESPSRRGPLLSSYLSVNGVPFENSTSHSRRSVSSTIESLRTKWINPDLSTLRSSDNDSLIKFSEPDVAFIKGPERGFIGVTHLYRTVAHNDSTGQPMTIGVYNSTAIVNREDDSTVIVNTSQTPQLIPLQMILEAAKGIDLAETNDGSPVPCSGGKIVFDFRTNTSSSGVWATSFPCSKAMVSHFYLDILTARGWEKQESTAGDVIALVRRRSGIETLAISCIESTEEAASLVLFSYQGASQPFASTGSSHP